ncbi:MAG: DUF2797 domain-containing protein [Bacteroidota bacterium]
MGSLEGNLVKMDVTGTVPAGYFLRLGGVRIDMNRLIGSDLSLKYLGKIHCIKCGAETRSSFFQGYCYSCFLTAPEAEECVLNPEKCRAHEGFARDMVYAEAHCLIPHVVYLAESGGLKVGVTRISQVPSRWIDQGASQAIELARTPNRYLAGLLEVELKKHLSDKTNWRKMLMGAGDGETDLEVFREGIRAMVPEEFRAYLSGEIPPVSIKYPVLSYPRKVISVNLEKEGAISGKLQGIRAQYLIFEGGFVINIRKYGGYLVELESSLIE